MRGGKGNVNWGEVCCEHLFEEVILKTEELAVQGLLRGASCLKWGETR